MYFTMKNRDNSLLAESVFPTYLEKVPNIIKTTICRSDVSICLSFLNRFPMGLIVYNQSKKL